MLATGAAQPSNLPPYTDPVPLIAAPAQEDDNDYHPDVLHCKYHNKRNGLVTFVEVYFSDMQVRNKAAHPPCDHQCEGLRGGLRLEDHQDHRAFIFA